MSDDILDDLFHFCGLATYIQQARGRQGWPGSEATRRRAFALYERELRMKSYGFAAGGCDFQHDDCA